MAAWACCVCAATSTTPRFAGALRWVLARGAGAAALSLAGLRGWTGYGKQAVVAAAVRFAAQRVRLALCGLQGLTNPFAGAPATSGGDVAVYPSLADALAGLARRA
jgi:hypothetical protein